MLSFRAQVNKRAERDKIWHAVVRHEQTNRIGREPQHLLSSAPTAATTTAAAAATTTQATISTKTTRTERASGAPAARSELHRHSVGHMRVCAQRPQRVRHQRHLLARRRRSHHQLVRVRRVRADCGRHQPAVRPVFYK